MSTITPDRLVAFWPCASASLVDDPNYLAPPLRGVGGWIDFADHQMADASKRGFRRQMLHLPFGKNTAEDGRMGMDQPADLDEVGRGWLVEDFRAAMRRHLHRHPDDELIVYVGGHEKDLFGLLDQRRFADHLRRMTGGILPLLDLPRTWCIVDGAVLYDELHPNTGVVRLLKFYHGRSGVEAVPLSGPSKSWAAEHDVFAHLYVWDEQQGKPRHARPSWASNAEGDPVIQGEVLLLIDGHDRDFINERFSGSWFDAAGSIVGMGATPVVQVGWGEFKDETAESLANSLNARAERQAKTTTLNPSASRVGPASPGSDTRAHQAGE